MFEHDSLFLTGEQREEFNIFFKQLMAELTEYAKSQQFDPTISIIYKGKDTIVYSI